MTLYTVRRHPGFRHRADDRFATLAAIRLPRLHRPAASIAKHEFSSSGSLQLLVQFVKQNPSSVGTLKIPRSSLDFRAESHYVASWHIAAEENEKATRQLGGLFFKGE